MTTSYKKGVFFFHTLYSSVIILSSACSSAGFPAWAAASAAAFAASAGDVATVAGAAEEAAAPLPALDPPAAPSPPSEDAMSGVAAGVAYAVLGNLVREEGIDGHVVQHHPSAMSLSFDRILKMAIK